MKEKLNTYRHEIKYYISKRQAAELSLFLRKNMYSDPYANEKGFYWVRSLYFDTIDNRDYHEKIIGECIRKKIRLRIYDISSDIVKLEIKNKYDKYVNKETVKIKREDATMFIQGDSNFLLRYKNQTANKIFSFMHQNLYRPTVIVDYEREAYLYPFQNIRITLDKNLSVALNKNKFFQENISLIPVLNKDLFILEIKFNHMIPVFLQRVLSTFAIQRSQISKYCLGRFKIGQ